MPPFRHRTPPMLVLNFLFLHAQLDRVWNHFQADLYMLQEKLEQCGIRLIDNEITYIEDVGRPDP